MLQDITNNAFGAACNSTMSICNFKKIDPLFQKLKEGHNKWRETMDFPFGSKRRKDLSCRLKEWFKVPRILKAHNFGALSTMTRHENSKFNVTARIVCMAFGYTTAIRQFLAVTHCRHI
jgi:hypothetical protein